MFEFIKGDVVELTPTLAILENNGIAYSINITISTYTAIQGKKNVCLYLYEAIREDAFILYGFAEKTERQMFLLLISVSGVGAGTARVILSSVSVPELQAAIAGGNEALFKGVKGIGLKTAQRIIIDLKDKVLSIQTVPGTINISSALSEVQEEAVSALVMLGFAAPAVRKVISKIAEADSSLSVEIIIKKALKMM